MDETLFKPLNDFILYRDTIKRAVRNQSDYIYPVAAAIFLSAGKAPDADELKRIRGTVRSSVSVFSNFRGNTELPLIALLAVSGDPESEWARIQTNYAVLKERFTASEYLALASAMAGGGADFPDVSARAKRIYKRMRKEHPFLTGSEDSVFALLAAGDSRTDDELIDDMEECYRLLDLRFPKGDGLQAASHVLALDAGLPRDKAERMIGIYDAIKEAGGSFGRDLELAQLAALSVAEGGEEELASLVMEADAFLKKQKGYRSIFGMTGRQRLMHAAMIVSVLRGSGSASAAAGQTALALIAAQQAAFCTMVAASSAASHAAAGAGR